MAKLNRDQILSAQDLKTETVAVPEWGGEVTVRALSGYERDQLELQINRIVGTGANQKAIPDYRNLRAKLVAASCIDEAGELLFSEADVEALGKKNAVALTRLFEVAQRLSGLGAADAAEMEKNSAPPRRGASRSA